MNRNSSRRSDTGYVHPGMAARPTIVNRNHPYLYDEPLVINGSLDDSNHPGVILHDEDSHDNRKRRGFPTNVQGQAGQPRDPSELLENQTDPESVRRKTKNMVKAVIAVCITMVAYCVFDDTYGQWVYVRFEMDVLGDNFSDYIKTSTSDNPCIQGNVSADIANLLNVAQSRSSTFTSWSMVIALAPAVFANIVLGAYTDRIGRRLYFILPILGYFLRAVIGCVVAYWKLDMRFLYIGLFLEGATGSLVALFLGTYVYTADNTTRHKSRSFGMVLTNAMTILFYAVTHLGVGYFISNAGYVWPMVTGCCISFIALLWAIFVIPETLQKKKERTSFWEGVKKVFRVYFEKTDNPKYKRGDFAVLLIIFFIWGIPVGAQFTYLFLMNKPLCWSSEKMAYVSTFRGLIQGLGSLGGMPLLQMFLTDEMICILGLISGAASRITLAFSTNDWMVYLGNGLSFLEPLVFPVIRAIFSRMVSFDKRGSLFASMGIIEVLTVAISGAGVNALYSNTVAMWPGFTYAFVAGCVVLGGILMVGFTIVFQRRAESEYTIIVEVEESHSVPTEHADDGDDRLLLPS